MLLNLKNMTEWGSSLGYVNREYASVTEGCNGEGWISITNGITGSTT